jgi:uncharacterized membrane protein YraQ (UPF0718 family)
LLRGVPTALTIYRSGSHRGPACAFLIAVPWFNWYGLTALVVFLGLKAGVAVSLSAVTVGFIAGVLIDTLVDPHRADRRYFRLNRSAGATKRGAAIPAWVIALV